MQRRIQRFSIIIFCAVVVVVAVAVVSASMKVHARESKMDKTTLCFGRFLIDLPAGATIKELGQQAEFMFGPIVSEPFSGGESEFSRKIDGRAAALKAINENDDPSLREYISPAGNVKIIVTVEKIYGEYDFGFEAYKLDGGILFSLSQKNFDEEMFKSKILPRLIDTILPKLHFRNVNDVPSQSGFCFKDGFIENDGSTAHYEEARMQINFKEWPDVWVSVYSQTEPKAGEQTLLQRLDSHPFTGIYATLALQIKRLRRGVHEVNGFKGEEVLELMPTDHGFKQHSFRWETLGAVKSIFVPSVILEFESGTPLEGEPRRPTLTDDQAIKLYDSVVNSIRLRPTTAPAKSSANEPPKKPLGELAATGRICPQTGWWQTNDAGVIADWRRRHFNEGERLPKALRHEDLSLWQKIKAERPIQPVAVVWQLVEYGEVPQAIAQEHPVQEVDSAKDVEPPTGG